MTGPGTAKEIFLEAIGRSGDDRTRYVALACGGDAQLRSQVDGLLRAHDEAQGFLSDEAPTVLAPEGSLPVSSLAGRMIGERIGPYLIEEIIGEGGFGNVYLARQDAPVRRQVALKILKPGMDTDQVIRRFEQERQTLAVMQHPGIARVFDASTTESGRPYFVMEFVDGPPLTDYCDAARLSIDERLRLFERVCRAVQHAHQKGVVHRDLKPSNILVTMVDGQPEPKVIDFGIAKAIEQTDGAVTLTQARQVIGTPLYMSPEQASGGEIDTRTDVYSLGVVLY
ncbi:MAG: serine/threonine-protein kinase, partial [Planctomycetota bacterium]